MRQDVIDLLILNFHIRKKRSNFLPVFVCTHVGQAMQASNVEYAVDVIVLCPLEANSIVFVCQFVVDLQWLAGPRAYQMWLCLEY